MQNEENKQRVALHKNYIKKFFEENKELIAANHDRLIDIIIELKAINFIDYIIYNFKEYSDLYIDDKESIDDLITRLVNVLVEREKANNLIYYVTKIENEMGIILPNARAVLAAAVDKTNDTSQKMDFISQTPDTGIIASIAGKIEDIIAAKNVEEALKFAEEKLGRLSRLQDETLNNSVKRLFDFVISTNNPKYIYRLVKTNYAVPYLLDALLKLNDHVYLYLYAAKIDNIALEDINKIVACVVTSGNAQFIGYLLWCLREKVQNKKYKYEDLQLAFIALNKCLNGVEWFVNYDEKVSDKLERALLTDNVKALAEFGVEVKADNTK